MRTIESAAIAGVVYAVCASAALFFLTRYPDLTLDEQELSDWFADDGNLAALLAGLNLAAVSSIAFLWFVAVIRRRLGAREDRFFATVFLGSALAYIGIWLVAASLLVAPAVAVNVRGAASIEQTSATLAFGAAAALVLVVGPRIQAVFVFSTSTLILRTGALPRWVAYWGYLNGLILFLVPVITRPVGIGLPIYVLVVSITILVMRSPHQDTSGA